MNFKALLKDISRLEKINKEIEEIKSPEYLETKSKEIFPDETREKIKTDLSVALNQILKQA